MRLKQPLIFLGTLGSQGGVDAVTALLDMPLMTISLGLAGFFSGMQAFVSKGQLSIIKSEKIENNTCPTTTQA